MVKAQELAVLGGGQALALSSGWYFDMVTNEYYYYDALSAKWYYEAGGFLLPMVYPLGTQLIASWEGTVLKASTVFAGRITDKWVNKAPEGSKMPMPASVSADGRTFEVGVKYRNESGFTITAGVEVSVWDPDMAIRATPAIDWTGMSNYEELTTTYNICRVDKPGNWTIGIRFLAYA